MSQSTPPYTVKNQPRQFTLEEIILLIGLGGFALFISLLAVLFFSLPTRPQLTRQPHEVSSIITPTPREFILPPTWTPTATPEIIPTITPTPVFTGRLALHLYQPRPITHDPIPFRLNLPTFEFLPTTNHNDIVDLARIIQGESAGDKEAAYRVGWVAKNRFKTKGYGRNYFEVSRGFFGYRATMQPSKEFIEIAKRIIRSPKDPTNGCLYALSRTDITNLGVPASRADVAYGEWFFFKTWPLSPKRH